MKPTVRRKFEIEIEIDNKNQNRKEREKTSKVHEIHKTVGIFSNIFRPRGC